MEYGSSQYSIVGVQRSAEYSSAEQGDISRNIGTYHISDSES